MIRIAVVPAIVATFLGVGCSNDGGTTQPPQTPEATQLVKSGGDQQAWYFNNPLPAPYRVIAQDANGQPVPGVSVTWSVVSSAGAVDPPQIETDSEGVASATHTLGPTETSQSVTASVAGLPTIEFMATAASPPPSGAVTVGNDFFDPRDVIVQVDGTITWTWSPGGVVHNVTYTNGPTPHPQSSPTQDSGMHGNTYTTVGRYEYVCTVHAGMEGTVTVVH